MKVDAFTYALMNNMDPVTGEPIKGGFTADQLYAPRPAQAMPGSGGPSSYMMGYRPGMNADYVRSANQPLGASFLNGLTSNIVVGTIGKIGEGVGMIANIPSAVASGDIEKLFDNSITNFFESIQEDAKDALPVYQGRTYQTGNILARMGTDDFWFNDGFDAVSFLLSAYVPGGAVSKVSKLAKLGKLATSINNLGSKAKGAKLAKLLKEVTEDQVENAVTQGVSTAYNTITEAGFEAKDTFDSVYQEYKKTMSDEEAKKKASQAAARVFTANMYGLLVPNAIQSSFMHGNNSFNLRKIKDAVRSGNGLDEILNTRAKMLTKLGEGIASEGLWEENFQNAVQRYERRMSEGWVGDRAGEYTYGMLLGLKGTAKAFIPGLPAPEAGTDEDEAAASIALGGLIGGGMGIGSTILENKNLSKVIKGAEVDWARVKDANKFSKNLLVDNLSVNLKSHGMVDETDANGNPTGRKVPQYVDPDSGQVSMDPQKMQTFMLRRAKDMNLGAAQVDAVLGNSQSLMDYNREMALMSYAWHLRSIPNLSKEDIDDLIKYDVQLPVSRELDGVVDQNLLSQNVDKIRAYMQLYDDSLTHTSGMYDFSDTNVDRDFGAYIRRAYFYDAGKKLAAQHMKETASDTMRPQLDQMITDIDSYLARFRNNIPKFRQAYDLEVKSAIGLGNRLVDIEEALKVEGITDEVKQDLEAEKKVIEYQLEELRDVDGYFYDTFGGQRATEYGSASLSKNEPAYHMRKRGEQFRPRSMAEKYYYNRALTDLFNIEVSRDFQDNVPVEEIFDKAAVRPELRLNNANRTALKEGFIAKKTEVESKNDSFNQMKELRDNMHASLNLEYNAERPELVTNEDEMDEYQAFLDDNVHDMEAAGDLLSEGLGENPFTEQTLRENPNSFVELYRRMDKAIKDHELAVKKTQAALDSLEELSRVSNELAAESAIYDNLTPEKRGEVFRDKFFEQKTAGVRSVIAQFRADRDGFSRGVTGEINLLNRLRKIFASRTDISDTFKQSVLDRIDAWLIVLNQASEVARGNAAKRYEIQQMSERSYAEGLHNLFNKEEIKQFLINQFGPEIQEMLRKVAEYGEKPNSKEGYEAILEFVRRKLTTEEQRTAFMQKLMEESDKDGAKTKGIIKPLMSAKLGREFFTLGGHYDNPNGLPGIMFRNPLMIPHTMLMDKEVFGERTLAAFEEGKEITPWQRYNLDFDFPKLVYSIKDSGYEGMDQAEIEIFDALVDAYSYARAYHALATIATGTTDNIELYKYEAQEFNKPGSHAPTSQQAVSFREAVRQLKSQLTYQQSAVFGIYGSGKTAMVARKVMEFLIPNPDTRKGKVLAFAQSEATSKTIADSVNGTQTSFDAVANMTIEQLSNYEYVVVDEAFTLNSSQIEVLDTLARQKIVKVLYLGDPSQNKSESVSTLQDGVSRAQPLTVVLRTNNPAITNFANFFQYNPAEIDSATAEATSTLEGKTEADSGVFVTSNSRPAEEQIIERAKNPNGKSKMIISNHNLETYRQAFAGTDVKVLSPKDSQGQEADEVYIDLSKSGEAVNGGPFGSALAFNTMVATAASRAKEMLVVANRPGLVIDQAIIADLNESIQDLSEEFAKYEQDYKESLDAYRVFYSEFTGIAIAETPQAPPTTPTSNPVPGPADNTEPTPPPPAPPMEPMEGDVKLKHPQNDNLMKVMTGTGFIVRTVRSTEAATNEKWTVMAPTPNGKFRTVGVLSGEEIAAGGFTEEQRARATSRNQLFKLDTDRTLEYSKDQFENFIVSPVEIRDVKPLWFEFGENKTTLTADGVQWLMRDFFQQEGVPVQGNVDANIRIYRRPSEFPNTRFTPDIGVPYIVLSGFQVPEDRQYSFPRNLHIPISAPKLSTDHEVFKTAQKFKTAFDTFCGIVNKDPVQYFNSEPFENLMDKFSKLYTVDVLRREGDQIVKVEDFDEKIQVLLRNYRYPETAVAPLFEMLKLLYAPHESRRRFTAQELEDWKQANPEQAKDAVFTEVKFGKAKSNEVAIEEDKKLWEITYRNYNRDGTYEMTDVTKTILGQSAGPMSEAWADLASSNNDIGGYFPRALVAVNPSNKTITKFKPKSFFGSKQSHARAFQWMKDTLRTFEQTLSESIKLIEENDPFNADLEANKKLRTAIDSIIRYDYDSHELEKVIGHLEMLTGTGPYAEDGPVHPAFKIYEKDPLTGDKREITPREGIQGMSTFAVPYSALEAIASPTNYGLAGEHNSLYLNFDLQKDGTVRYDMGSKVINTTTNNAFNSAKVTTKVKRITPTAVTINLSGARAQAQQTPEQTARTTPQPTPETTEESEQLIATLAQISNKTPEQIRDQVVTHFGSATSRDAIRFLKNTIARRNMMFGSSEEDVDEFNQKKTVFADTVPGKLQTIEWAKATLKKILPGLDIDQQVQFLDTLQMSILEKPNEDILGQVHKAIMRLKKDENGRIHDQVVYHEAFHMAWNYLFSERLKTRLREAFRAVYGREMTDKQVTEGLAELYQRFDTRFEKRKTWVRKLIDAVRGFFDTMYKHKEFINDVFFNLDEGKYSGAVRVKVKEGAPDNISFIKDNFGTRGNYLQAVRKIKDRIEHYKLNGKDNLPMTRDEIFEQIYRELEIEMEDARIDMEMQRKDILTEFGVKNLGQLRERLLGLKALLEKGDLNIFEEQKVVDDILKIEQAFVPYNSAKNAHILFTTLTGVNKHSKKYVFYEIVENLYPSYKAEDAYQFELDTLTEEDTAEFTQEDVEALDIDGDASVSELQEAFEGLKAETIDHAKVNWSSKQSLALKDIFAFIPLLQEDSNEPEIIDGIRSMIHPKIAYVRGLQLLLQLDLNGSNLLDQIVYLQKHEELNRWDRSILHAITELFGKLADIEERHDSYSIVAKSYPLDSRVEYYFFNDRRGGTDAHATTYEDAKELVAKDPERYKLVSAGDKTLSSLYAKAVEEIPSLTREEFSNIFYNREAINSIANLQSFMGSLKDTTYKMSIKSTRGKTRTLSMVDARGGDSHVNTRSVLKEAIRAAANNTTTPLFQKSREISSIIGQLESNIEDARIAGIKELLSLLGLKDNYPIINSKLLTRNAKSISSFLKTILAVGELPTHTVVTYASGREELDERYDIDAWLLKNNSALTALSKVVAEENKIPKSTMITSVKKQRIYKHTLSNPIYNITQKIINVQERLLKGVDPESSLVKLPEYLELQSNKNPFLMKKGNGFMSRIYSLFELDGHKDRFGSGRENGSEVLAFDKKKLHTTLFSSGFLSNLEGGVYQQLFYQQADKPRPIGATISILNSKEIKEFIPILEENIKFFMDEDRANRFRIHSKSYSTSNLVNGTLLEKAMKHPKGFEQGFKELIAEEAFKLANDLIEARVDTVGTEAQATGLVDKFDTSEMLQLLNTVLDKRGIAPIKSISQLAERSVDSTGKYVNTVEMLMPYAYAYLMNHYINSYFMNQLVAGSSQFYGSGGTVLKRMTGAAGPGHIGWTHPRFGTKSTFKVIVVGDESTTADQMFDHVKAALSGKYTEEEIAALRHFFGNESTDRTDGQVFITPARLRDLQKGYGREFRLSNILKPKYFGPRIEELVYGEGADQTRERVSIPTYIKPSAVVLSDELLYQPGTKTPRPGMEKLASIRQAMERDGIDELAFGSAVKVGNPKEKHSLDEFIANPSQKGIMNLSSEHYGIQLNPRAKVDSSAALFTQLTYFLNIYSSSEDKNNIARAEAVYSAIAFLFEKGGKLFERDTDNFKTLLQKAFSEKSDELVFADLIEAGIQPNSPIFEQKALIKLASLMEKLAIKIRLPGGKLVLQSDVGVNNPQTGQPLKFTKENGKLVAEVIVPRGLFPEDLAKRIEAGDTLFENPTLLGFRIPSTELHSAVAMKVVGFYDNEANTNMVIAPELLVALHGSDFDVDSLFFAKRPIAKQDVKASSKASINALFDIAVKLDELVENDAFKGHPASHKIYDALNKIRKNFGSNDNKLTTDDYNDISSPRALVEIEQDFLKFAQQYRLDPTSIGARKEYAKLAGLAWLEKKTVRPTISEYDRSLSPDPKVILNSRRWQIASADTYALFDVKRQIYNLSKDSDVLDVFPAIQNLVTELFTSIQKEKLAPAETFIKKGEIIGFKLGEDGIYRFDPEFDTELSNKIREVKLLADQAKEFKLSKLYSILNRQYKDLLGVKEEYYKGAIIDTFLETISDAERNELRMMRPISKSFLVGKKAGSKTEYAEDSAIYSVAKHGLVNKEDVDLSNYNDVYTAFKSVADMQRLTGIFASSIKVLAYIGRSGVSEGTEKLIVNLNKKVNKLEKFVNSLSESATPTQLAQVAEMQEEIRLAQANLKDVLKIERREQIGNSAPRIATNLRFNYTVNGEVHHIASMNEFVLGTNQNVSIYDVLDALVNIAIDNIKDQELFALQATAETGTIYSALISLGLPTGDIIAMMYHPSMQDLLGMNRNDSKMRLENMLPEYLSKVGEYIESQFGPLDTLLDGKTIGITELDEMLTSDKFKALKTVFTEDRKRQIKYIENLDQLDQREALMLYQYMHIMNTGKKLGDDISTLSKFMGILRGMPISFEGIQTIEQAIEKLGAIIQNAEDSKELDSIDKLTMMEASEELKTLGSVMYTKKKESGYKIAGFMSRNPHILAAYRRLLQLKATIQKNFPLYSEKVVSFMKDLFGKDTKLGGIEEQGILRKELRKYLLTQLIDRDFYKEKYYTTYASRKTGKSNRIELYGVDAWSERFIDSVRRVKEYDQLLAKQQNRAPNAFLDALYMESGKLRFNFDVEMDRAMIEELRQGFKQLRYFTFKDGYKQYNPKQPGNVELSLNKDPKTLSDFDLEYNATEFQKDFLFYLALVDGLRFANNNYSVAVTPRIVRVLTDKLDDMEKKFRDDAEFRDKLAYHIKIELLRENAGLVSTYINQDDNENYLIRSERTEGDEELKDEQGKTVEQPLNGVATINGRRIFYDKAYNNPYETTSERETKEDELDRRFPAFISSGYDSNAQVYMRITSPTDDVIAYTSVGRASETYTRIPDISKMEDVKQNFEPTVPTQYVADVSQNTMQTYKNFDYLLPGEPIRLVGFADKSRLAPRYVVIKNVEKIYEKFGVKEEVHFRGYKYTFEDYVVPSTFRQITDLADVTPGTAMTSLDLVNSLLNTTTITDYERSVLESFQAKYTKEGRKNTPIVLFIDKLPEGSGAQYNVGFGYVNIKANKVIAREIIHELTHAETHMLIVADYLATEPMTGLALRLTNPEFRNVEAEFSTKYNFELTTFTTELTNLQVEAAKAYRAQFNSGLESDDEFSAFVEDYHSDLLIHEGIPYGLSDPHEMLAEFVSNEQFRELTKLIKITPKETLYDRIINLISRFILGKQQISLYDVLDGLMREGVFNNMYIRTESLRNTRGDYKIIYTSQREKLNLFTPPTDIEVDEFIKWMNSVGYQLPIEKLSDASPEFKDILMNRIEVSHNRYGTDARMDADKQTAAQYSVNPNNEAKYQKVNAPGLDLARVSDDIEGWMSFFKRNPKSTTTIEEKADRIWGNIDPMTQKFTRHGWINRPDWVAKEAEIEARGKNRGRLVHSLMELYSKTEADPELEARIEQLLDITGYDREKFKWVQQKLDSIYRNADINTRDDVDPDQKDKIGSEVTVANDILGLAGTIDMLIYHADGTLGIKDIKAGYSLFNSSTTDIMMFGEQPSAPDLIYDTWFNHAKLQVMTYAFLYKSTHPEAKFKDLDVLWMPDKDSVDENTFRNMVNPEPYLNMIHLMLKEKMPEKYQALKDSMSAEDWKKLWDPKEYKAGVGKSLRDAHTVSPDLPIDQQIKAKIEKIRTIILTDLNPNTYSKAIFTGKDAERKTKLVSKLMKEVLELQKQATDLDIQTVNEDISGFQNWLFTSATTSNPYIQVWDELFMARRDEFNKQYEQYRNKFLSLLDPIKNDYLRRHPGKATLDALTRGGANHISSRDLFSFAYIPVKDEGGDVIDYQLRHTDAHFQELIDDNTNFGHINATNIHIYKNFLNFVNDSYARFFVDQNGTKALANRTATYYKGKGAIDKPISNIELYNGKRAKLHKENLNRDKELFEYKRGFMPKVPPLLSEFGLLTKGAKLEGSKQASAQNWWKTWYHRNLTFSEEHAFEGFDKKAMAEGLPMKYLNNKRDFASNPDLFSLNLEHQFDRFMRAYLWKEQMDDVFAYGQGIRIMLNAQKDNVPDRTIEFMKRELDLKLRGRPAGYGKSEKFISKNRYNVSLIKVLSKIKYLSGFPLMGLNYIGGTANAIFTGLLTLKHAAQNQSFKGKSLDGLNGSEWDFGLKDLAKAWPEVLKIMKAGMVDGNVRNSKAYLMAKKFGYFPNSFDWSTAHNNLITDGNRVFNSESMFLFYSLPEEMIALTIMTAQLMSMKVKTGPFAGQSVWDLYEMVDITDENGNTYKEIKWKEDPNTGKAYVRAVVNVSADPNNPEYQELTELDGKEVRRLYNAYDRMHGGYRKIDNTMFQNTIWGTLAIHLRRFLPHVLRQALTSAGKRSAMGFYKVTGALEDGTETVEWVSKVMEGRWAVTGKILLRLLAKVANIDNIPKDAEGFAGMLRRKLGNLEMYDMDKLDAGQLEAFRDAWVTLMILAVGMTIPFFMGGDGDDDDPMNRFVTRIFNDLTQMYNIYELGKNVVTWNPVSLNKLHDFQADTAKVLFSLMFWAAGDEEKAFTPDGRLEGLNRLMKDLPVTSMIRKTEDFMTSDIFNE